MNIQFDDSTNNDEDRERDSSSSHIDRSNPVEDPLAFQHVQKLSERRRLLAAICDLLDDVDERLDDLSSTNALTEQERVLVGEYRTWQAFMRQRLTSRLALPRRRRLVSQSDITSDPNPGRSRPMRQRRTARGADRQRLQRPLGRGIVERIWKTTTAPALRDMPGALPQWTPPEPARQLHGLVDDEILGIPQLFSPQPKDFPWQRIIDNLKPDVFGKPFTNALVFTVVVLTVWQRPGSDIEQRFRWLQHGFLLLHRHIPFDTFEAWDADTYYEASMNGDWLTHDEQQSLRMFWRHYAEAANDILEWLHLLWIDVHLLYAPFALPLLSFEPPEA